MTPNLWFPLNKLTLASVKDISPGKLLFMPYRRRAGGSYCVGIRCKGPESQGGSHMVFALTPFAEGTYPAGDSIDLTHFEDQFLTLEAELRIEPDILAPTSPPSGRDLAVGDLTHSDSGAGLTTFVGRHIPGAFASTTTLDTATWTFRDRDSPKIAYGRWRLRIDFGDRDPLYYVPEFGAAPT